MKVRQFYIGSALLAFGLALLAVPLRAEEISNEDCLLCHENFAKDKFAKSVHADISCTSCHTDIKELPHPEKLSPVHCSDCHDEATTYYKSDHGKAVKAEEKQGASCKVCHGDPHGILPKDNPESPTNKMNVAKTCGNCHENPVPLKTPSEWLTKLQPLTSYMESVHGKGLYKNKNDKSATCIDCHGSHGINKPGNTASTIFKFNVPETCGKCHTEIRDQYWNSVHGKAIKDGKWDAPVCTDCHGEHNIHGHLDPKSTVFGATVSERTCAACHGAEKLITKYRLPPGVVKSYMDSYHGLASKFGVASVANCASCHGAHEILPSADPKSSVNRQNLPQTCGKCHAGVTENLTKGKVHITPNDDEGKIVYYVSVFYVGMIFLVVGFMILHNSLDFLRKIRIHVAERKKHGKYLRFSFNETIQHHILAVTFITLAYTGFALKYPLAWWSYPFMLLDREGMDWRGVFHKSAAVIFVIVAIYHVFFVIITKRGRSQLREFVPTKKDLKDFFLLQKYNLGQSQEKPKFGRYNYIEKMEYWALMWGAAVMIITGSMLTFENLIMRYLPKWALDLATAVHFYEAVLATFAILVWHFYFVIYDPEHYPLSTGVVIHDEERINDPLQRRIDEPEDPKKEDNK